MFVAIVFILKMSKNQIRQILSTADIGSAGPHGMAEWNGVCSAYVAALFHPSVFFKALEIEKLLCGRWLHI